MPNRTPAIVGLNSRDFKGIKIRPKILFKSKKIIVKIFLKYPGPL